MYYGLLNKTFDSKFAKSQILEFAQDKQFLVSNFVNDFSNAESGDVLLVPNISYFGLNLIKSLDACVSLGEHGVSIFFVEQPELSIEGDGFSEKLATFKAMLESERGFISARAKAGMKAAKAKGVKLGRPKGSSQKVKALDKHKNEILGYLKKEISTTAIMKLINSNLEKPLSYFTFKNYVDHLNTH
jgi:DNA invertase Pin-like site-specific DNA recombinase